MGCAASTRDYENGPVVEIGQTVSRSETSLYFTWKKDDELVSVSQGEGTFFGGKDPTAKKQVKHIPLD